MFDKELAIEILSQISEAIIRIQKRFEPIRSVDDFTNSEYGMEKLDSICMPLIAIGESLKNLDKATSKGFFLIYPEIDWKRVKGLRDIISHHYFDVDADVIYDICKNHIEKLKKTVLRMIKDLETANEF